MTKNTHLSDADIERLMRGQMPPDDSANGDVARFLETLDRAVPEASTSALESAHTSEIFRAAAEMARPDGPQVPDERPRRVRVGMFQRGWIKVGGLAVAGVLALGGTAYAGILPAPIQNAVSMASETVGLHVPPAHRAVSANRASDGKTHSATPGNGRIAPAGVGSLESSASPRSENASHTPGVDKSTASNHGRTVSATRKAAAAKAAAHRNAAKKAARAAAAKKAAAAKAAAAKRAAAKAKAQKKSDGTNAGGSNKKPKKP